MRRSFPIIALVLTGVAAACSEPVTPSVAADSPLFAKPGGSGTTNPRTLWRLPLNGTGLGLVSDGLYPSGDFSVYSDAVCGVSGGIFVDGSGDATLQTNNPTKKDNTCSTGPRKMSLVYSAGDVVYPQGGTETMLVFLNLRNIWNSTTDMPPPTADGVVTRQLRILSLNPTQTERCDAWRWSDETHNNVSHTGDKVWVERLADTADGKRRYHVYTQDRGPTPVAGANRATCTTTLQNHNLSVDFYIDVK